jgi:hypothetical protein
VISEWKNIYQFEQRSRYRKREKKTGKQSAQTEAPPSPACQRADLRTKESDGIENKKGREERAHLWRPKLDPQILRPLPVSRRMVVNRSRRDGLVLESTSSIADVEGLGKIDDEAFP